MATASNHSIFASAAAAANARIVAAMACSVIAAPPFFPGATKPKGPSKGAVVSQPESLGATTPARCSLGDAFFHGQFDDHRPRQRNIFARDFAFNDGVSADLP